MRLIGLTLISSWISNHIHYKMWDEITCPFPNLKEVILRISQRRDLWWKSLFDVGSKAFVHQMIVICQS